jgi:hypothetical protein
MATGETPLYDIPYPVPSDPVDVAGDIQSLAERLESVLPTIGLPYHALDVTNSSGVTINKGDPVYISGFNVTSGKPEITKSQATNIATFPVIGLAEVAMGTATDGSVIISGIFTGINTTSYSAGDLLYVGSSGGLTDTQPATGSGVVSVVAKSNINGVLLVGAFKGNGTWGSLKAGLA